MPLHDYQQEAHERAVAKLLDGQKELYVAPTGSGKSFVMAANHDRLHPLGLLTAAPTTEIALGIWEKLQKRSPFTDVRDMNEYRQQRIMEADGVWTLMRLHNALMDARINPPKYLQFDEGHHTTAQTYETTHALAGDCPAVAYTATGFRGTPEETQKLRKKWGEPHTIITLAKAIKRGVVARPDFSVWPLLNDDVIKVTNGEFETKAVEKDVKKIVPALCMRIRDELCEAGRPKRATMVTAPGVASAGWIYDALCELGIHCALVTGDRCFASWESGHASRQDIFRHVSAGNAILVQVNVVGEGVDLPIRVHVDTAPCMSPVRWMQRVGRGTRPTATGEDAPLYICTNHNLTRHAYLWAGIIPRIQIAAAQQAWGPEYKPVRRTFARAIGLEGFGKFQVAAVPLYDGTSAALYALQTNNGTHQYAVLLHPCIAEPYFFERANPYTGELLEKRLDDGRTVVYKEKDYSPWKRIPTIPNADGYVSVKAGPVTEKMLGFWKRSAASRGLDKEYVPNWREFQALPILLNARMSFEEK